MKNKILKWMKNERSASQTTENGMLMLGGIALAVGVSFLVAQYMKSSGTTILDGMDSTAAGGIDPDSAPANTGDGWLKQ
ncbi:hypothetical protein [Paenibacillus sp. Leaf72]|uniref:hypothetical protein n=1 Tax=Paenibacillus sp. Leaf72 TaxID=1736234 RepID=UPI0006FF0D35|nr:hypothetical protein [Paenibacillus sp. Leaf72]KQN96764.1 hypothetical protein ASF12_22075 [Paenibacillus sp. Leaf72]KQN96765.1 hypothetical protein ASF12_22080 [Paenibacillus sp. Leaf72]